MSESAMDILRRRDQNHQAVEAMIDQDPGLTQLYAQVAAAMTACVERNIPIRDAEGAEISADAQARGAQAYGLPLHPDRLIVTVGDPEVTKAFVVACVLTGQYETDRMPDRDTVMTALRNLLAEYQV